MVFHDILNPQDPLLDQLAAQHRLHPLHIEDCRHGNQNAKIEDSGHYIFVVFKPVDINPECGLSAGDLDIFFSPDFIIVVRETNSEVVRRIIDSIDRNATPAHCLHQIFDQLVDSYPAILDRFNDSIEIVEDEVLSDPTEAILTRILTTRRGLAEMRRILANTRDLSAALNRLPNSGISPEMKPFFRDIYDHITRALDTVEMQRDNLTTTLELYLTTAANRTNRVMKILTVLSTVALPALVITGFYGMNVQGLPHAADPHAIAFITLAITAGMLGVLLVLRYLRWL